MNDEERDGGEVGKEERERKERIRKIWDKMWTEDEGK